MTGTAPRPRITLFTRSYPPAYLTGGPTRSLFGLVETLAADFRFAVVTSALDDPADGPMPSVRPDRWSSFGHAAIWYELSRRRRARRTIALLRQTRPQLVYLNSLFDYRFSILPLLLSQLTARRTPVVLAPRGELGAGALALKPAKKRLYLTAFRLLRLHRKVAWHASTPQEQADIERVFGTGLRSHVAIDLRTGLSCHQDGDGRRSEPGEAPEEHKTGTERAACSLVFFARIVPVKNLATVIRAMSLAGGGARLTVAGPIEDPRYWAQCTELIGGLPDPGLVRYTGVVAADDAVPFLGRFDLLVLPTLGENFGHVVLESLAAGTPVIVGRDTPWRQVETAGAGWLCDPARPQDVAELIRRFAALDDDARARMRRAARQVAAGVLNDSGGVDANRAMFQALACRVPA